MDPLLLLAGDAQNFLEKVWASQVHVHHTEPERLIGLLSTDDVDHLLTSTALRTPALRIAESGTVLPAASFTRSASLAGQQLTGLVDARKVLDLFDDGATVVLQGLHRYWPPLTELVRELELALGHPCQANAYLTPPDSQGFALHEDTHDVFVFQTHGSKLWEVHDASGARVVRLEPGICMYLPTGTPHAARAQVSASLHVTIGINRITWRDLLRKVTSALLEDERYDGPIPAGYLENPTELATGVDKRLLTLGQRLLARDGRQVAEEQCTGFLTNRGSALRGGLVDRLRLRDLGDDTMLERRPTSVCILDAAGDRLRVFLGDRTVLMPRRLHEPMQLVAERPRLRPLDLSRWLDQESRLVLARRLVREGLLRIVG